MSNQVPTQRAGHHKLVHLGTINNMSLLFELALHVITYKGMVYLVTAFASSETADSSLDVLERGQWTSNSTG
jgi:hypothetical protein